MDLPDLKGRVVIDTGQLESAVGRASKMGSAIGTAIGTVGGGLITKGLDLAGGALESLTTGSIDAASNLNETANKIQTIFGPGAKALNDFAATADTKLGLSKQSALDAAATFGVFGKSAGLSGKDLTGFSSRLVGLSADLASFHNTSPEEAIDAIGAALRGESEPMRRYGVLLDDASLRQEALKQGLVKTTKEALTPQQKVLAAQALIMKQTAVAQGDFAKTSDGLANSQRVAKAQFENLQTQIGAGLLPIVNKIMNGFVAFMPVLQQVGGAIGNFIGPVLGRAVAMIQGLFSGGGGLAAGLQGLAAPLASVQAALAPLLQTIFRFAGQVIAVLLPALRNVGQIIFTNVVPAILSLVRAVAPIANAIIRAMGPVVLGVLRTLGAVVGQIMAFIGNVIRAVAAVLRGDWSGAWNAAKAALGNAVSAIGNLLRGLWNLIGGLFRAGAGLLSSLWSNTMGRLITGVVSMVGKVLSWFRGLPGKIIGALASLGSSLWQSGVSAIQGFINGIIAKAGEIVGVIRDKVVGVLPDFVKDFLGIHSPSRVMAGLGRQIPLGIAAGIASTAGAPLDALDRAVGGLTAAARVSVPGAAVGGLTGALSGPRGGGVVVDLSDSTVNRLADAIVSRPGVLTMDGKAVGRTVGNVLGSDAFDLARGGAA